MKKLISTIVVTILMIAFASIPAKANESTSTQVFSEVPTEGVRSKYDNMGTGNFSRQTDDLYSGMSVDSDTTLITFGECSIGNNYDGTVLCYGRTLSSYIIPELGYTLYLQVWNGYAWTNIYSTTISRYNTTSASQYNYVSVQSGRYYRVKVDHYATDYLSYDSATSISDYIYIN